MSLEAPSYLEPGGTSLLNATVYNRGLNNESTELFLMINGTVVNSTPITELLSGTSYTISYLWAPTDLGTYNVTAYAPPVSGENYTYNNMATRLVSVTYPLIHPTEGRWAKYSFSVTFGGTTYTSEWNFTYDHYVSPHLINVNIETTSPFAPTGWLVVNTLNRLVESGVGAGSFYVGTWYFGLIETSITLGSKVNLMSGEATVIGSRILNFSGLLIDCWELSQESGGSSYTYWYDKGTGLLINEEWTGQFSGKMNLIATNIPISTLPKPPVASFTYSPEYPAPSDTVTFDASASLPGWNGTAEVPIANYTWDFGDGSFPVTEADSVTEHTYTAVGTYIVNLTVVCIDPVLGTTLNNDTTSQTITIGIYDIAIISVTLDKNEVTVGGIVNVTLVVMNNGSFPETFNVTVYYNSTEIDTKTVTDLAAGVQITLNFTWNTFGVAAGNYTIKAKAETLSGETDTANNEITVKDLIHVIPEFPTWTSILLIFIVLMFAVAIYKRRLTKY